MPPLSNILRMQLVAGAVISYEKTRGERESNNSIKLTHLCHHQCRTYILFTVQINIFLSQGLVMLQ